MEFGCLEVGWRWRLHVHCFQRLTPSILYYHLLSSEGPFTKSPKTYIYIFICIIKASTNGMDGAGDSDDWYSSSWWLWYIHLSVLRALWLTVVFLPLVQSPHCETTQREGHIVSVMFYTYAYRTCHCHRLNSIGSSCSLWLDKGVVQYLYVFIPMLVLSVVRGVVFVPCCVTCPVSSQSRIPPHLKHLKVRMRRQRPS